MKVISKPILGFERYLIYSDGRVYDTKKGKFLKLSDTSGGYLRVRLVSEEGVCDSFRVHRLVAEAFIPNPDNLIEVNHKDEIKTHNFVIFKESEDGTLILDEEKSNLEWCTREYNMNYGTIRKRLSVSMKGKNKGKFSPMKGKKRPEFSGENHPLFGTCRTDEQKKYQSEKMSGENNPMHGKNHTEEACAKMSTKYEWFYNQELIFIGTTSWAHQKMTILDQVWTHSEDPIPEELLTNKEWFESHRQWYHPSRETLMTNGKEILKCGTVTKRIERGKSDWKEWTLVEFTS